MTRLDVYMYTVSDLPYLGNNYVLTMLQGRHGGWRITATSFMRFVLVSQHVALEQAPGRKKRGSRRGGGRGAGEMKYRREERWLGR